MDVTVQPGMIHEDLNEALRPHGTRIYHGKIDLY